MIEKADFFDSIDPERSAPGKLAKDRRCKSSTG